MTPPVQEFLQIRGARVHNLKNVSVAIPHNQFTVITGVSGSGKSSLAFDTIYSEGQRRYLESLSAYARQFLERMEKPDVDDIDGIAPAIAIRQKNTTRNPRSTVATTTECYDFLRLLFARAGGTYCPTCGTQVQRDTVDHVAARLLGAEAGSRWYALFPIKAGAGNKPDTQALRDRLFDLRKKGFTRLFQEGRTFEFSTPESLLEIDFAKPLFVLADRLVIGPDQRQRLVDTVETCYREAGGIVLERATPGAERLRFSEKFACKTCGIGFDQPEPRLFSFNSPFGACPRCQGFGNTIDYDLGLVVPEPARTLRGGAIKPWRSSEYKPWLNKLRESGQAVRFDTPWCDLSQAERDFVWYGNDSYSGLRGFFAELEKKKYK